MNETLWAQAMDFYMEPDERILIEDLYELLEEVSMDAFTRGYKAGHDTALGAEQPDVDYDGFFAEEGDEPAEYYEGDSGDETDWDAVLAAHDEYDAGPRKHCDGACLPPMQEQRKAVNPGYSAAPPY
jgi:hypothetical protein